jgi:hypothetical protein
MAKDPLQTQESRHPSGKWRVVIEKLNRSKPFVDPKTGRQTFQRLIPGLNIAIPWPSRAVTFKETRKDRLEKAKNPILHPDTPTPAVVKRTFGRPTLYYPPLPEGIELELHNQYSQYKRQKFARAIEQMAEWRRRHEPGFRESEALESEIEKKDQNVYTSEQLRIRAVNKLVQKARRTYFKRTELTVEDTVLMAGYIKAHIESKMKSLIGPERAVQPLTPLEQDMSPQQRLEHRRRRAVLEKPALEEQRIRAIKQVKEREKAARENKGRNKVFVIEPSKKPPVRKRVVKKKKRTPVIPAR